MTRALHDRESVPRTILQIDDNSVVVWGNAATSVVWGERLIWGTRIVWGNTILGFDDGTELLYGDRIVWGNVTAERLIWGNLSAVTTHTATVVRPPLVSR